MAVMLPAISMMHFASRVISRVLKGRTRTATFTDDMLASDDVHAPSSVCQGARGREAWINFAIHIQWHQRLKYLEENIFSQTSEVLIWEWEGATQELYCAHVLCFEEVILISKNLHLATGIGFWTSSKF